MRSPFRFARHGQCGMWVSEALPQLAHQVDDLALIRSMHTTNLTHEPAVYMIQSGKEGPGRPTLGAWTVYGLGSENQNLPAYVVLDDPLGLPVNGVENWQAGFLPPTFQGTRFRSTGSPVLNLRPKWIVQPMWCGRSENSSPISTNSTRSSAPDSTFSSAHRQLQTGRPHATGGDRRPRSIQGDCGDLTHVRRGNRGRSIPTPVAVSSRKTGGARRAFRAALH